MKFTAGAEPSTRTVVRAFPDSNRVQVFLVEESAVQSSINWLRYGEKRRRGQSVFTLNCRDDEASGGSSLLIC